MLDTTMWNLNASTLQNFIKMEEKLKLQASDIKRISDAVKEKISRISVRLVPLEEIRANDLPQPKYSSFTLVLQ